VKIKKILGLLLVFILVGSLSGCGGSSNRTSQTTQTQTQTQAQEQLVKISFDGSITPNVVKSGEKVVIAVTVENLDDAKTIENVRLLFSSSSFLNDGLAIVNVMSQGTQDGRSFTWQSDLTKIPPKEKRTFQIVATANKPGTYTSVIQIKPASGTQNYSDNDGNEELNAKIVVTE
jgi:hypothetical protein